MIRTPSAETIIASLPDNNLTGDAASDRLSAHPEPTIDQPVNPMEAPAPKHPQQPADQAERSLELAMAAAKTAQENRGQNIRVLDMREITPVFDYFVVATGNSRRQLHAISEEIDHCLEDDLGDKRMGIEGYDESRWILLDYGSIVVHLFDEETRDFYAIEDLWNDAVDVTLPWDDESQEQS